MAKEAYMVGVGAVGVQHPLHGPLIVVIFKFMKFIDEGQNSTKYIACIFNNKYNVTGENVTYYSMSSSREYC